MKLERLSSLLARRALRPAQMEPHLRAARRMLAVLEGLSAQAQEIEPIILRALLSEQTERVGLCRDEPLGRFVA